jgi:hypothetical protein
MQTLNEFGQYPNCKSMYIPLGRSSIPETNGTSEQNANGSVDSTGSTEWQAPVKLKEVQMFLGFAIFYWKFIRNYSKVVQPLCKLTRKLVPFSWGLNQKRTFVKLKEVLTSAPILANYGCDQEIVLETDVSTSVSAGVLFQYNYQWILHPPACIHTEHTSVEENYEIYDQKLGVIFESLEQ